MPGEAMGAICRLVDQDDPSREMVINVEYNQLDTLLKAGYNEHGDVPNETGFSPFPGNINTLVFKIPEYVMNLEKTKGVIPEFVNPKYADSERTLFKSPTRLECMMQDYPRLLTSKGAVGFTTYETWYSFSPVKNNINDAAALYKKSMPSFGAAQGEYDFFNWTNRILGRVAKVQIHKNTEKGNYGGVELAYGPKILLEPSFAISLREIKEKIVGINKISKDSTLILKGAHSSLQNLDLDGYLVINDGT